VIRAIATGLGLLAATACTRALPPLSPGSAEDDAREVVHAALEDDLQDWDPALAYDESALEVLPAIYESLYQFEYLSEDLRTTPLLAADPPHASRDGRTFSIPIRAGTRFEADPCLKTGPGAKGRELVAGDFVYALKRLAQPGLHSQGWWFLGRRIEGMEKLRAKLESAPASGRERILEEENVPGLSAADDHRLVIRFVRPLRVKLVTELLAQTFTAPLAAECVRAYADPNGVIASHPVGTGPFRLQNWEAGIRIVLERSPSHRPEFYPTDASIEYRNRGWLADAGKALPLSDGIVFELFADRTPAWHSFLKGRIDVLRIPRDHLPQAITNRVNLTPELEAKGVRLSIEKGASFNYLFFNFRDPLVGRNRALRQAISSAIDRTKWIELFTASTAEKMTSLVPPGIPDRPQNPALRFDHDLERAKALLKKAGYPGGRGLPVLKLALRGADGFSQQLGEFFVRELAAVGIRAEFSLESFPIFLEHARKGQFQIAYGNWEMDYPDAENVFSLLYGKNTAPGPNLSSFNNRRFDSLFERMSVAAPGPGRAALVRALDHLVQEETPWVLGYDYARYTVTQPWLLGYRSNGMILNKYKYVRVNPTLKARYLEKNEE
jgi:ABC-type transport system substrate-binding protein